MTGNTHPSRRTFLRTAGTASVLGLSGAAVAASATEQPLSPEALELAGRIERLSPADRALAARLVEHYERTGA